MQTESERHYPSIEIILKPGDKILGFDLSHGGHLTHGSPVNFSGKLYKPHFYGVEKETGVLNYDKIQEIANEVAVNHIKLKPMEVTSKHFNQVKNYFDLLDFSPIQSKHIGLGQKKLIGGRYCSIKAIPAAQLRYEDQQGGLFTVYQTDYDSHVFSQLANNNETDKKANILVRYAKGLRVDIWLEQGLVLASVRKENSGR